MTDITLRVNGDSSGAQQALAGAGGAVGNLSDDVGKAVVKWQELANVTKKAIEFAVKFGVDAVKAFAEAERIQAQLVRVAGDHAGALEEQAEAMSKLLAVDDDVIKQTQTLMVQWGGVGAASEKTTKAILDYAAATGQDAVAATQDLIRNVESGGTGLAKMGVHFKVTGDKGKDLASAVDALSKKFGGAAKADANTLHGSLAGASIAFDDFKKAVGETLSEMLKASGVVPQVTSWFRELKDTLFTPKLAKQAESKEFIAQQVKYWEDIASGHIKGYKDFEKGIEFTFEEAQAKLIEWQAKLNPQSFNAAFGGAPEVPGVTGKTNKAQKEGESEAEAHAKKMTAVLKKNEDEYREYLRGMDELDEHARQRDQQQYAEELSTTAKALDDRTELLKKTAKERDEIRVEEEKKAAEHAEKLVKAENQATEHAMKESLDRTKKKEQEAKAAADAIGSAFVNALAAQLEKLAEGGEFDAALFVGEILASVVAVAGTVIGTAYGQPALGAALGNLGAMGVRAGFGAMSKASKRENGTKTYHSGGWVGDEIDVPRYHSGTWVGADERRAILQTGERVLSRGEVAGMGGPAGVDAAARGGPMMVVNVTALDAKSAADGFVGGVARGMRDALNRGQGPLPQLLGVGPR